MDQSELEEILRTVMDQWSNGDRDRVVLFNRIARRIAADALSDSVKTGQYNTAFGRIPTPAEVWGSRRPA